MSLSEEEEQKIIENIIKQFVPISVLHPRGRNQ